MLLRRTIAMAAIILAALFAITISKLSGGNTARIMQVVLYVFIVLMVVGFIWWKYGKR